MNLSKEDKNVLLATLGCFTPLPEEPDSIASKTVFYALEIPEETHWALVSLGADMQVDSETYAQTVIQAAVAILKEQQQQEKKMNWFDKITINCIEEEDGSLSIHLEWDETDPVLQGWNDLGKEGQRQFMIDALTTALKEHDSEFVWNE